MILITLIAWDFQAIIRRNDETFHFIFNTLYQIATPTSNALEARRGGANIQNIETLSCV